MIRKTTVAAALLTAALATPALAAPPADQDACNKLAFGLADKAAAKKLPEADAAKVDDLIGTLETQCGDGKLAERRCHRAEGRSCDRQVAFTKSRPRTAIALVRGLSISVLPFAAPA